MKRWILLALAVVVGLIVVAVVAFLVSSGWLRTFGGRLAGARLERARQSPHFSDGKFHNAVPTNKLLPGSFFAMVRHQLFGREQRVPPNPIPIVTHGAGDYATPPASGLRATWIGHASALIEIDGRRVLTDPIWSDRCSPSTVFGPKRFFPPPIALADLPPIDVVVISHDHYDHLDMATVTALAARGTHFAVPLGVGAHFDAWGVPASQVTELDWNQSVELAGLTVTATPARHYSGRNPLHGDETLWASWAVKGPAHRIFFSGDSGPFDGFKDIGAAYGPFDLALIKIGACDVTWPDIHMTPEEAVEAHVALGAKVLLPVHWGTFNLAFHDWNDPARRVVRAAAAAGVSLVMPRPGELVEPAGSPPPSAAPPPVQAWWE